MNGHHHQDGAINGDAQDIYKAMLTARNQKREPSKRFVYYHICLYYIQH